VTAGSWGNRTCDKEAGSPPGRIPGLAGCFENEYGLLQPILHFYFQAWPGAGMDHHGIDGPVNAAGAQ
jgi:hypothetical protein